MTIRCNAIGLVVADMGRSLDFYRRLGMAFGEGAEGEPHVEVTLDGGFRIMWDTVDVIHSFDPGWRAPAGGSRASLAFDCASPAEVDATYAAMAAAGDFGHHEPWDAVWGYRYATLRDPDGNGVDLYAAPEAASS